MACYAYNEDGLHTRYTVHWWARKCCRDYGKRRSLTVLDNELEPWLIEKDKNGNTYFSFAAIENDEFVLTDIEWEKLLKLMPARDYRKIYLT